MKSYSREMLSHLSDQSHLYCVEFKDGSTYVGFFNKEDRCQGLTLPFNDYHHMYFSRSHIKRIVSVFTGVVVPKTISSTSFKTLDLFELNDMIHKANCQLM